jgi:hypothetical protein
MFGRVLFSSDNNPSKKYFKITTFHGNFLNSPVVNSDKSSSFHLPNPSSLFNKINNTIILLQRRNEMFLVAQVFYILFYFVFLRCYLKVLLFVLL